MPNLLLASRNPGKLREFRALLQGLDFKLLSPREVALELEVKEDGVNYAENAAHKALAFALHSGLLAIGDDSGLEVEVLEGAPGLYSHRFVPQQGATDADRRAYLLQQLHGYPRPWQAQFRCVVAIATPEGQVYYSEGTCPGEIIPEERGDNGFGYDPIFLLPGMGRTMAEMSMEEKNQHSHRARAVKAAIPLLKKLS